MIMRIAATAIVATFTAGVLHAATFTDRTTFQNAINISYIEDFESMDDGTYGFTGPITFGTGLTVSSESNQLFSVGVGQSTNPTQAIGSNTPDSDSLLMALGGTFKAFGADLFQNDGGGAQTAGPVSFIIQAFLGNVLVDSAVGNVLPNGGSFLGLTSASAFDNVRIFATGQDLFEVADNATVGDANVVPLPAGLPLMLAGLGAFAALRRKRAA